MAFWLILSGIGNAQVLQKTDEVLTKALLGTWEEPENLTSDKMISESTYTKDGIVSGSVTMLARSPDGRDQNTQFKVHAHWKVNNGTLLVDNYETIPAGIIPKASVVSYEIALPTQDELILQLPSNKQEHHLRRKANPDALHFDGVYQVFFGGGSQSLYLRFYRDEYVVAMSYAGSPEEVAKFVSRKYYELPQGKYVLSGSKIAFNTKAERGENDYVGTISGGHIACHLHSRITDFSGNLEFVFWEVTFPDVGTPTNTKKEALPADAYCVPSSVDR